jgi:hypothetical protein
MNIYRHAFTCHCPNNGIPVVYQLEIHSENMIQVEDIVSAAKELKSEYHEALADNFCSRFGGFQILKGHHHGVDIETHRDGRAATSPAEGSEGTISL